MTTKQYRARVYAFGSVSTASATVYNANLIDPPSPGGQIIRYSQGRVESSPWTVRLIDNSTSVTSILADSSGRMDMMSRVCDVQVKLGTSTSWTTLGGGRVSNVMLEDNPAGYTIVVDDEHSIVRQATIFKTANTMLQHPAGFKANWFRYKADPVINQQDGPNALVVQQSGRYIQLSFRQAGAITDMPDDVRRAIIADVDWERDPSVNTGTFKTLQCAISTAVGNSFTNYKIPSFEGVAPLQLGGNPVRSIEEQFREPLQPWIDWGTSSGAPSVNTNVWAYVHMPTSGPTSRGNFLHIGASSGINPMRLALNVYRNVYGGFPSSSFVRLSTAAWSTGSTGLLGDPRYGVGYWRIERSENAAQWLEDNIWGPYGVIPFIDNTGKISPRSIQLPNPDTISTGSILTLGSSNLAQHPTWRHTPTEITTEVQARWNLLYQPTIQRLDNPSRSADGVEEWDGTPVVVKHDRISSIGTRTLEMRFSGLHDALDVSRATKFLAKELFDRFGDGPIEGEAIGASTGLEAVKAGDYVKMKITTFPNPQLQGRGGTRIVQITGVVKSPAGPNFTWIDAGPNLATLAQPNVTVAQSTINNLNAIKVTVSAVSTAGTGVKAQLQVAQSNTTSAPAATSRLWNTFLSTLSSGVRNIQDMPSGTKMWARVRNVKTQRIRSSWHNSTVGVTTATLATPTGIATTSVGQGQATIVWTNTSRSSGYPVEVLLGQGSGAGSGRVGYVKGTGVIAHDSMICYADFYRSSQNTTGAMMGMLLQGNSTAGSGSDYQVFGWRYNSSATVKLIHRTYLASYSTVDAVETADNSSAISVALSSGIRIGLNVLNTTTSQETWVKPWKAVLGTTAGAVYYSTFRLSFLTSGLIYNNAHRQMGVWWKSYNGARVDNYTVTSTAAAAYAKDLFTDANGTLLSAHVPSSGFTAWTIGINSSDAQIQSNEAKVVASGGTGASTSLTAIAMLPPASNRYRITGLNTAGSYTAAVRAHDPLPLLGVSANATVTFLGTTTNTAPTIHGLARIFGTS